MQFCSTAREVRELIDFYYPGVHGSYIGRQQTIIIIMKARGILLARITQNPLWAHYTYMGNRGTWETEAHGGISYLIFDGHKSKLLYIAVSS